MHARKQTSSMPLWCNAVFVHEGFQHMVSNVLVWLALALPLEHAYGTPRILAVWLISALGSAFFSAAFEDSCTLVCSQLCPFVLLSIPPTWQFYSAACDSQCLQLSLA